MKRKIIAVVLSALMITTFTPIVSFATEDAPEETEMSVETIQEDLSLEETDVEGSEIDEEESADSTDTPAAEDSEEEKIMTETGEEGTAASEETPAQGKPEGEVKDEPLPLGAGEICTIQAVLDMAKAVCDYFFDEYIKGMDDKSFVGHWTVKYTGADGTWLEKYDSGEVFKGFGKNSRDSVHDRIRAAILKWYDYENANAGSYLVGLFGYDKNFKMGGAYGIQDLGLLRSEEVIYDDTVHEIGQDPTYWEQYSNGGDFDEFDPSDDGIELINDHPMIAEQALELEQSLYMDTFPWCFEGIIYGMVYSMRGNDKPNDGDSSPATGDEGKVYIALAMATAAVMCGLAAAAVGRRKNNYQRKCH